MPPFPMARPNALEVGRGTTWIEDELDRIAAAEPDPGRVTARRLNRAEYNYSVRDRLGVDFHRLPRSFEPWNTSRIIASLVPPRVACSRCSGRRGRSARRIAVDALTCAYGPAPSNQAFDR